MEKKIEEHDNKIAEMVKNKLGKENIKIDYTKEPSLNDLGKHAEGFLKDVIEKGIAGELPLLKLDEDLKIEFDPENEKFFPSRQLDGWEGFRLSMAVNVLMSAIKLDAIKDVELGKDTEDFGKKFDEITRKFMNAVMNARPK
jgi:hypothetical protein